jgi:hypothetical protein
MSKSLSVGARISLGERNTYIRIERVRNLAGRQRSDQSVRDTEASLLKTDVEVDRHEVVKDSG